MDPMKSSNQSDKEPMNVGRKDDKGKARLDLIPEEILRKVDLCSPAQWAVKQLGEVRDGMLWPDNSDKGADWLWLFEYAATLICQIDRLDPVIAIGEVLAFGAAKYGDDNWRMVLEAPGGVLRYRNAALRHISARLSGELNDLESGFSHIAHAACCFMFLACKEQQCGT